MTVVYDPAHAWLPLVDGERERGEGGGWRREREREIERLIFGIRCWPCKAVTFGRDGATGGGDV